MVTSYPSLVSRNAPSAVAASHLDRDASPEGDGGNVQAVEAAFVLLSAVAAAPDLGLSELARRAGLGKARAYRLLRTLEKMGMLAQGSDATWRLGLGSLVLGEIAREQIDIARLARPVLAALCDVVGETALLRVREDVESVCIALWLPDRDVRAHVVIGSRRPLHIGSGKVLLAHAPEEIRERVLAGPLERFTDRTVTDPARLREILARIRRDGVMASVAELGTESGSIAAPVRSASGEVVATIALSAPLTRMGRSQIKPLMLHTQEAAARLSAALGFVPPSGARR